MNSLTRVKVARNADYHQQMADYYAGLSAARDVTPKAEGNGRRAVIATATAQTEEAYLASLHADIATQLRDVLGTVTPPEILGATPPVTRESGPVLEPRTRRQVH